MAIKQENYREGEDNACYSPNGFTDSEDSTGNVRLGDWREIVRNDTGVVVSFQPQRGRYRYDANQVRDAFRKYFLSQEGQVPWQWDHVRSCGPRLQQQ